MRYRVRHETRYRYGEPVLVSLHQVCLRPRSTSWQDCPSHQLTIHPSPHAPAEFTDAFGNVHVQFALEEPHAEFSVRADSEVAVRLRPAPEGAAASLVASTRDSLRAPRVEEDILASQFLFASPFIRPGPDFRAYVEPMLGVRDTVPELAERLAARIHREFTYDQKATSLNTSVEEVLALRRGVCQDLAQVMIAGLRSVGLAARYVSGYLLTVPPPGQPRLVGADASHCWVSVYDPSLGWLDVDPTNGGRVGEAYVTVAWGRDYADVTPVKGVILGGGQQAIRVEVDVLPEAEFRDT